MAFQCKQIREAGRLTFAFSGVIDEHAEIPAVPAGTDILKVDLDATSYINSIGIRTWIQWAGAHKHLSQIQLFKCPVLFTKNLGIVKDFLAPNMKVHSFYVPYYSDDTDERKDVLFVRGVEYEDTKMLTLPRVLDSKGRPMEMDIFADSYFSFIK